MPTSGSDLVFVGTDNKNLLHIRIFDVKGNRVTDTDQTKLLAAQATVVAALKQAVAIAALKQQLPGLLPPHVLTDTEKAQVIREATSIVGQTHLNASSSGAPPLWSPDGKQFIISLGRDAKPKWGFTTLRVNGDGTGQEKLAIPPEDTVQDWSADGRRLLTASQRGAKFGWQLYVMRPDGTDQRRITDGGNPFYARFSPDGRRVLYTDGARGEQSGIRVIEVDGKNDRLVFAVDCNATKPSACWSPDGKRVAITLADLLTSPVQVPMAPVQVVVMDLDGGHRLDIFIPEGGRPDMPDWR